MLRYYKGVRRLCRGGKYKERGQGAAGSSTDMPAQAAVGWSPAPPCPGPHAGHGARGAEHGEGQGVPVGATSQQGRPQLCAQGRMQGTFQRLPWWFWVFPKDKGG